MRFVATGNAIKAKSVRMLADWAKEIWVRSLWGERIGESMILKIDKSQAVEALADFGDDDRIFVMWDGDAKRLIIGAGFLRV